MAMLALVVALLSAAVAQKTIGERFYQRAVLTQKYDVAAGGRFYSQQQALTRIAGDPIGVGAGRSDVEFGWAGRRWRRSRCSR